MRVKLGALARKVALISLATILLGITRIGIARADAMISIGSCQDLQKIGNDNALPADGNYVLDRDIDCTADTTSGGALYHAGAGFAPIAGFTGSFDGQGHTIRGLHINRPDTDNVGLFAVLQTVPIYNLRLIDGSITGGQYTGSIVGQENEVTLQNVSSNLTVTGGDNGYVGGLIGFNNELDDGVTHLTNVRYSGNLTSSGYSVAGLIGDNDGDAIIAQSMVSGNITNTAADDESGGYVGGLVGDDDGELTITESFVTGNVSGPHVDDVGGLVGWSSEPQIDNSYVTGNVTGISGVGGLAGYSQHLTVSNSYVAGTVTADSNEGAILGVKNFSPSISATFWDNQTTGQSKTCSATCLGATGLTTADMQDSTNFTDADWDYDITWTQTADTNGGYPYLRWLIDSENAIIPTSLNGHEAKLSVPYGCFVNIMEVADASHNSTADNSYSYPAGMMNYQVDCGSPDFTIPVTAYFYGVSPGQDFSLRKYNPNTQSYNTVTDATISFVTIDGQSVAKVVYNVTDGGSLDTDGVSNGIIEDPIGLSVKLPAAPNTGAGQPSNNILPILALLIGTFGLAVGLKKQSKVGSK